MNFIFAFLFYFVNKLGRVYKFMIKSYFDKFLLLLTIRKKAFLVSQFHSVP